MVVAWVYAGLVQRDRWIKRGFWDVYGKGGKGEAFKDDTRRRFLFECISCSREAHLSVEPGRLAGRTGICSDYILGVQNRISIRYIKGTAERRLGRYHLFSLGRQPGEKLVCHLTIFLQHE